MFILNLKCIGYKYYMEELFYQEKILEAVNGFQRCQRNFDLDKNIDNQVVEILYDVALSTPTKQNLVNFDIIVVTNRQLIRQCAQAAVSESVDFLQVSEEIKSGRRLQNPQVDCNLLFLYVMKDNSRSPLKKHRDPGPIIKWESYIRLVNMEIGISVGALGLVANILGFKTGCCKCYNEPLLPDSVFTDNGYDKGDLMLMFGIGYPKFTKHTLHTDGTNTSDTFEKEPQRRLIIS